MVAVEHGVQPVLGLGGEAHHFSAVGDESTLVTNL